MHPIQESISGEAPKSKKKTKPQYLFQLLVQHTTHQQKARDKTSQTKKLNHKTGLRTYCPDQLTPGIRLKIIIKTSQMPVCFAIVGLTSGSIFCHVATREATCAPISPNYLVNFMCKSFIPRLHLHQWM